MRLLVTRPLQEARATAARLAGLGHEALLSPVIKIGALAPDLPDGEFRAILATSAHAFLADSVPGILGRYGDVSIYVAGSKTWHAGQSLARQVGMPHILVVHAAGDARGLADKLVPWPPSRFLYLAGRDRKPHVEALLTAAGHAVVILETYAADKTDCLNEAIEADLHAGGIDGVLHYSRRSAEIFLDLAQKAGLDGQARHLRHFCLSSDVAQPLLAFGAHSVQIAAAPNERSLFELLSSSTMD